MMKLVNAVMVVLVLAVPFAMFYVAVLGVR